MGRSSTGFPYSDGRDSFSRWDTVAVLGSHREYIGRIFNETKNRPTYIAREYNGVKQ